MAGSHRPHSPPACGFGLLAALLVLTGCLPGTGGDDDRSLAPADSASIAVADAAEVDTLTLAWTARAPDGAPLLHPTSLGWLADGRIAVVETQGGAIRLFGPEGADAGRIDLPDASYPYFAGAAGDTVAVLARGTGRIVWASDEGLLDSLDLGEGAVAARAASPREAVAVRRGGGTTEEPARLDVVAPDGSVLRSTPLPVDWRAAGFVRTWGDTLVALSGYRPVVDLVTARGPDTLALRGFTSPQMARSAQFMRGDVDQPPLLTSSADAVGDALYVLNLRGDHVRIEVYGRDGRLQRALVSPRPWSPLQHVPIDVGARRAADGALEFAVLMQRSAGLLQSGDAYLALYRWSPTLSRPPSRTETRSRRR